VRHRRRREKLEVPEDSLKHHKEETGHDLMRSRPGLLLGELLEKSEHSKRSLRVTLNRLSDREILEAVTRPAIGSDGPTLTEKHSLNTICDSKTLFDELDSVVMGTLNALTVIRFQKKE
jgi:hypothetical protein